MRNLLFALACSLTLAVPALSSETTDHSNHSKHGSHAGMTKGVHTTGEVHTIDGGKVNLSHEPIPEIGWPAMRMDLPLLEGAETGSVAGGDKVMIMLEKGPDGTYGIRALEKMN